MGADTNVNTSTYIITSLSLNGDLLSLRQNDGDLMMLPTGEESVIAMG
jgi:hypothetical protein